MPLVLEGTRMPEMDESCFPKMDLLNLYGLNQKGKSEQDYPPIQMTLCNEINIGSKMRKSTLDCLKRNVVGVIGIRPVIKALSTQYKLTLNSVIRNQVGLGRLL